jgi:hypothetical protein
VPCADSLAVFCADELDFVLSEIKKGGSLASYEIPTAVIGNVGIGQAGQYQGTGQNPSAMAERMKAMSKGKDETKAPSFDNSRYISTLFPER